MSLEPYQEEILKQLINQEALLSRLYTLFSRQFPQSEKLWKKLSKEEERHAKLIEKLYEATKTGLIFFNEGKTKTQALAVFIKRLEGIVEKAEKGKINFSEAFAYAIDYESSLIEKNVFLAFDSLSAKAKATLKMLQSETIKHVDRIKLAQESSLSK